MKRILSILLSLSVSFVLTAQERHVARLHVYFENAQVELTQRDALSTACDSLKGYSIRSIRIDGYASPAGPLSLNAWLAGTRAKTVADAIISAGITCPVTAEGHGEDWTGLMKGLPDTSISPEDVELIEREVGVPGTEDDPDNARALSVRNQKLHSLKEGRLYNLLSEELFPLLRRVDVTFEYEINRSDAHIIPLAPVKAPLYTIPLLNIGAGSLSYERYTRKRPGYERRYIFALRSNALLPLTNIGIIVPIGKHFSIGGDWYSPWFWHDRKNSWCLEFQAADVEFRYWFNPRHLAGYRGHSLTGHSISIGAFAGHYDFERDNGGFQGEVYGGYLDYTYSLRLARALRLEFSLGMGYARLPWREYRVYTEGGKLIRPRPVKDNYINWFGPVKVGVSLVIPIVIKVKEKEGLRNE